ncbi:MAG: hypothetical protein K1X72_15200 [Pyrinomonadaceae bacterium]|nr:hypothetical protein [Pyrinomonadaceae bacterium]
MKYIQLIAIIFSVGIITAFTQTNGEINKNEIFGGYSFSKSIKDNNLFIVLSQKQNQLFHGSKFSFTRNFNRFFGVKFQTAQMKRNVKIVIDTNHYFVNQSTASFLGGVQIKDNLKEKRFRPFGHVLIGAARNKELVGKDPCPAGTANCQFPEIKENKIALNFGGGVDIKLNKNISLRAIQVDYQYNRTTILPKNSLFFSTGINFNF